LWLRTLTRTPQVSTLFSGNHGRRGADMRPYLSLIVIVILIVAGCEDDESSGPKAGLFVTSATSVTGNLGGLTGADATCQRLAAAAGHGDRTWRAYLSVERDPANGNQPTH